MSQPTARITLASMSSGQRRLKLELPRSYNAIAKQAGAKFNPGISAWLMPPTDLTAHRLLMLLEETSLQVDTSDAVKDMLVRAANALHAGIYKTIDADKIPPPSRVVYSPWEHQLRAHAFAVRQRGTILNLAMGTGKTKVAVDLINSRNHHTVLVVAPLSAIDDVWERQVPEHDANGRLMVIAPHNMARNATVAKKTEYVREILDRPGRPPVVVVINYEMLWREPWAKYSLEAGFDLLILDESHNIKNPKARTSQQAHKLADNIPYRLLLTGTPLPHSPLDAWSQYRVADAGVFGDNYHRFQTRYALKGGFQGKQIIGYRNMDELSDRLSILSYRVGSDVLDLPPALDEQRSGSMNPAGRRVYDDIEQAFYAAVGAGEITVENALTKLLRLQQLTGGWAAVDEGDPVQVDATKEGLLIELLDEIGPVEPVVVFGQFHNDLDTVHKAAATLGLESLELSGRRRELAEWKQGGAPTVLAVQIQAGGTGIDLTRARYGVYYSTGLNLGNYLQSRARLHRPGQERSVWYYHLLCKGTIDIRIYRALQKRENLVEAILNRAQTF